MIQKISAEDLKKMQDREGLVLQGCGGDLREWEDGIHQMLAEEKILQNGAHFKEGSTAQLLRQALSNHPSGRKP